MSKIKLTDDLIGRKFGKLTAQYRLSNENYPIWHCVCDCGNEKDISKYSLLKGATTTCGNCRISQPRIDLTSQVFGKLIVKSFEQGKWKCLCECGEISFVDGKSLRKGKTKSCGNTGCKVRNKEDFTNRKIGYILVKEYRRNIKKWLCVCDCGKEIYIPHTHLRRNGTKSCGCKTGELISAGNTLPNNMAVVNYIFRSYVASAKRRRLFFDLSLEQLIFLIYKNCFYCDSSPTMVKIYLNSSAGSPPKEIAYNGIDRIHNEFGYTLDNCISCCRICNRAKSDMPYEEFMTWIEQMLKYRTNI